MKIRFLSSWFPSKQSAQQTARNFRRTLEAPGNNFRECFAQRVDRRVAGDVTCKSGSAATDYFLPLLVQTKRDEGNVGPFRGDCSYVKKVDALGDVDQDHVGFRFRECFAKRSGVVEYGERVHIRAVAETGSEAVAQESYRGENYDIHRCDSDLMQSG